MCISLPFFCSHLYPNYEYHGFDVYYSLRCPSNCFLKTLVWLTNAMYRFIPFDLDGAH